MDGISGGSRSSGRKSLSPPENDLFSWAQKKASHGSPIMRPRQKFRINTHTFDSSDRRPMTSGRKIVGRFDDVYLLGNFKPRRAKTREHIVQRNRSWFTMSVSAMVVYTAWQIVAG